MLYVILANELKQERAASVTVPPLDDPVDLELDKLPGTIERKRQSGQRMRLDDLSIEVGHRARCPQCDSHPCPADPFPVPPIPVAYAHSRTTRRT